MGDNVFNILEGKRQKIADNYLSLKAYAVSAADKVDDYVAKGKGRALSAIGDLLATVGAQGAVHALQRRVLAWVALSSLKSSPASPSRCPTPWVPSMVW